MSNNEVWILQSSWVLLSLNRNESKFHVMNLFDISSSNLLKKIFFCYIYYNRVNVGEYELLIDFEMIVVVVSLLLMYNESKLI